MEGVEAAFQLVIPSGTSRDMNRSDLNNLMKNYSICEQALDAFLAQEITFSEYCELLEIAKVNIDSYLETVEHNLITLKLI